MDKKKQQKQPEWTEEMDALLGTDTDANIAERLGISRNDSNVVRLRRVSLGVEPFYQPCERPWTPEEESILGTMPLKDVSKRLDRSVWYINKRMKKLGIAPYKNEKMKPLGRTPIDPVQWTEEMDALLGTDTDVKIAERLGITRNGKDRVCSRRNELGIKAFYEQPKPLGYADLLMSGLAMWTLIWKGYSKAAAAKELGFPKSKATKVEHYLNRTVKHPDSLGRDLNKDEPEYLIEEIRKRVNESINEMDIEARKLIWRKPWPLE
ncbi:hypothetical protein [Vibrio parahaemolyticus]|uniref:hypothetical protein n=1 Tax=Vibrio parahaemolyticus TaxID=670 RepID=UPI00111E3346|nr:hypothetical protein [Vibrio parahaemolyticus]MDG2676308.1 hypothetical protein [Vibrio parahaemolyticus]HBH7899838.1 hypothetical protein [Vibrio parahaemolyticus]